MDICYDQKQELRRQTTWVALLYGCSWARQMVEMISHDLSVPAFGALGVGVNKARIRERLSAIGAPLFQM